MDDSFQAANSRTPHGVFDFQVLVNQCCYSLIDLRFLPPVSIVLEIVVHLRQYTHVYINIARCSLQYEERLDLRGACASLDGDYNTRKDIDDLEYLSSEEKELLWNMVLNTWNGLPLSERRRVAGVMEDGKVWMGIMER